MEEDRPYGLLNGHGVETKVLGVSCEPSCSILLCDCCTAAGGLTRACRAPLSAVDRALVADPSGARSLSRAPDICWARRTAGHRTRASTTGGEAKKD